jgi:hypothetical protein
MFKIPREKRYSKGKKKQMANTKAVQSMRSEDRR